MDDFAIRVQHVSKDFHYTSGRAGTIKSLLTSTFKNSDAAKKDVQHALRDVSFDIKKGEFFGIVGRNGSGKSTLLKMIAGIYQPNSGKIHVSGKLVPFIELGVGFNPELTGKENVYLNGSLLGFSRKEIEAQYDEIVEFAELEKFMDQQLKNYSSGMQVRLAFSMAVRAKADVLLIDEVLAVGDADFQRKCFDYFKQLKILKKTVIFVSHDMSAVREYCDRVVLINESRLVQIGTADKISQEYTKLFNTNSDILNSQTKERWGNGSASIINPTLKVSQIKGIEICFEVKSHKNIDDPIIGFYFMNEQGQQICGSNTLISGKKIESFKKDKTYKVIFNLENIFTDGIYKVTLAVMSNKGTEISDWWVDVLKVKIVKTTHAPYLIDLPFKIDVVTQIK